MQSVGAKCEQTLNRCQERENMQAVPSAGKHVTGVKRGKIRLQAVPSAQVVSSANKRASGVKRGKTDMTSVLASAGKHDAGDKGERKKNQQQGSP